MNPPDDPVVTATRDGSTATPYQRVVVRGERATQGGAPIASV